MLNFLLSSLDILGGGLFHGSFNVVFARHLLPDMRNFILSSTEKVPKLYLHLSAGV
jgi:hypothetical protein